MLPNKTRKLSLSILGLVAITVLSCHKEPVPPAQMTPPPIQPAPGSTATTSVLPGALPTASAVDLTVDANGLSKSTVTIATKKGNIRFKFYSTDAPITSKRIVALIQKGFYNGLTFHRVENWVIQGGDPTGTGTGGSGERLKAEFNRRRHKEGTVGMARSMDPDSADSQFYITFNVQPHLDNSYTVFGQVVEGMDIAHKIEKGDVMTSVTVQ